ncbi:protein GUCD1-like isoform X2 [Pomacea canaliculata]|uniref:protein GUCD1-like isoform X2 n=1 Tax=Pomacea canaliculata TaxID=400727 RepID=UPI000D7320B3|nr:protein GUCD1-like isoform X2 [Pomacea canaliculata]
MEESRNQNGVHHMITVPLVQQYYSWDCGLACVSMVLSHFHIPTSEVYTKDLDFLQCGESIWTIDLAYLLARYKLPHQLCTITLGANSDYATKLFYKGSFGKDEERINRMFKDAEKEGVCVEKRSVSLDEIIHHLSQNNIAIVLTDWCYLECLWCHSQIRRSCLCCLDLCHATYQGHYIVLCGFDRRKGLLFYKNPNAHGEDVCCCRLDKFEKARKSHGTDEDILFVFDKKVQVDK